MDKMELDELLKKLNSIKNVQAHRCIYAYDSLEIFLPQCTIYYNFIHNYIKMCACYNDITIKNRTPKQLLSVVKALV